MSRRGARWTKLLGLVLAGGMAGAGCGGGGAESHPPQYLTIQAQWNDSPSAVDQIGYQMSVDLVWPDRLQGCYPLPPTLALHIDDDIVVAPPIEGDCADESLTIVNGVAARASTTVSLQDGDQVLAEASFDGLFPYAAATLVAPAAGQAAKAGDPFAIALPVPPVLDTTGAQFYWTDIPSTVPPFYSWAAGTLSADGSTLQGTIPAAANGHAIVVVKGIFGQGNDVAAASCTGFQFCNGLPSFEAAGPISLDVEP